jgi:pantetheine-phosphate adenylyltransferase
MKIAFAGSFDPLTLGHLDIIQRLAKHFEVFVVVGKNETKNNMFSVEERVNLILENTKNDATILVCPDDILMIDFLKKHDINLIARGVRESYDFIQEMTLAHTNFKLSNTDIETILFPTRQDYSHISSSSVKAIAKLHGDISFMVPSNIEKAIKEKLNV